MRVLGTAGHVDHGKSTLVEFLTGINPDRLKEEQERQMTIDLGFAWMELPDGESVGIIDVPGHRDFIENMLAGVGGIDAALLVIAADEGVMPQTREHLDILDLLEVQECVVALSKVDLVEDSAWLRMVTEEVEALLKPTRFAKAKIVPISAVSGTGVGELVDALSQAVGSSASRLDIGKPRLPIDRAFSIAGFGTVVTGTLIDGALGIGDEVIVAPAGLKGRIRGLQTHKAKVERAIAGSRVAANVTSIEASRIARGDVVCREGEYVETGVLDASLRMLGDAAGTIKHNQQVKIFLGTAQRIARLRLLEKDLMEAGEEGWIQLVLEQPVVAARGDRYILRRPSPGATLGGGRIADAHPVRLHRRKDAGVVRRLNHLLHGSSSDMLIQLLRAAGPMLVADLVDASGLDNEAAWEAIEHLVEGGKVLRIEHGAIDKSAGSWVIEHTNLAEGIERIRGELRRYHERYPLREGMPREELKSRTGLEGKPLAVILGCAIEAGEVAEEGSRIRDSGHRPTPSGSEEKAIESLMARFRDAEYSPPSAKEALGEVGEEIMTFLVNSGRLIRVSADVVFERETYQRMVAGIEKELKRKESLTVAEVRDIFKTSRKYALALMEHLDEIGKTVRDGDSRRLA